MTANGSCKEKSLGKLSLKQLVKCICPKCEKMHECFMYWTGRGTPKIFCKNGASGCNVIAEELYELELHEVNTDIAKSLLEYA
jgi:hypothetical protein